MQPLPCRRLQRQQLSTPTNVVPRCGSRTGGAKHAGSHTPSSYPSCPDEFPITFQRSGRHAPFNHPPVPRQRQSWLLPRAQLTMPWPTPGFSGSSAPRMWTKSRGKSATSSFVKWTLLRPSGLPSPCCPHPCQCERLQHQFRTHTNLALRQHGPCAGADEPGRLHARQGFMPALSTAACASKASHLPPALPQALAGS